MEDKIIDDIDDAFFGHLYQTSSYCGHCGSAACGHAGWRTLSEDISVDDVLDAWVAAKAVSRARIAEQSSTDG